MEFALALTLLAGGGMAVSALLRLMNVDLGFRGARTLTFDLPVARGRLATAGEVEGFYRQVLDRTKPVPGVSSASVSTGMPISGANFGREFEIADRRVADSAGAPGRGSTW